MDIDPEWLGASSLLDYIVDASAARAEGKGLTLTGQCPESLQLYADVRAVKQIGLNLLSNAIKFTPEGGHITLTAAALADGGVGLAVSDTGAGMSYETITRLMRPFAQADNRFGIGEKGSGLGLVLVKGLMELHQGRLTIDSHVGRGSTFTLFFPPGPTAPPAPARYHEASR